MIVMNDESNRLYIECRPLKVLRRQEAGVQQESKSRRVPERKMHKAIKPSPSEKDEKGIFQFLGGFAIVISKQGRSRKGGFWSVGVTCIAYIYIYTV